MPPVSVRPLNPVQVTGRIEDRIAVDIVGAALIGVASLVAVGKQRRSTALRCQLSANTCCQRNTGALSE